VKSRRIEFRASEYEAAQWDALASARGIGISDLCRALLNAEVTRAEAAPKKTPAQILGFESHRKPDGKIAIKKKKP
jgi:hypothetical protein